NFTYPRYSLDFSFFRAYGTDGKPLTPDHFFRWSVAGSKEGDAVFVVGNPGSTSRLSTVSQLRFERDYAIPQAVDLLRSRLNTVESYVEAHPDSAQEFDLKNVQHQISNQLKKNEGELAGLRNPDIIARRQAAEDRLKADISAVDSLREEFGSAFAMIEDLQRSKEAVSPQSRGFTFFASDVTDSHVLVRAVYGYFLSIMSQRGAPPDRVKEIREDAMKLEDWPEELEVSMLAARLRELSESLGTIDPTVNRILQGRSPEEAARAYISGSALMDSASFAAAVEEGYLSSGDPTIPLAEALTPLYLTIQQQVSGVQERESELNALLARARFALHGEEVPPDATFSLRIADGVVSGYPYNGTMAAPYTTFFGMFDHYHSYGGEGSDWDLPENWFSAPETFDRTVQVNLVSTNDITGGNSGSPLLNKDLEIVGLIFDSNIDALVNTYIYLDDRGRAVAVDSRGILEALDDLYEADRIVNELTTGAAEDSSR
ncbi:MAG: S46 family peptidase, partial [Rhodothermales bacterium]